MNNVYYVQRLEKPRSTPSIFSFGGGLVNGGISPEGFKLLKDIMSFDYMGSAEFEWGAVPTALQALAKDETKTAFEIECLKTPVYVICPEAIKDEVTLWVSNASVKYVSLKESLGFQEALAKDQYSRTVGWLKIEDDRHCKEPFMFFIDKDMFDNVCKLFSIKTK